MPIFRGLNKYCARMVDPQSRRIVRLVAILSAALSLGATAGASPAFATRRATASEVTRINRALPDQAAGIAAGCVAPLIKVSGRYAKVTFTFAKSKSCEKFGFDGYVIVQRTAPQKWKSVFAGSVDPDCPSPYPSDLVGCTKGN